MTREVFDAVRALLDDPNRRVGPGAAPKRLGSGIYRCGICTPPGTVTDKPVTCQVTLGGRAPRYCCKDHNHLTRNVVHVDRLVFAHVAYALTHPRAYTLLRPAAPEVDAEALRADRAAIRARLVQMAEDEVLGLKTRAQVIAATKRGTARMEEIDQLLNATMSDDPLAALVSAPDPVKAWKDSPLANQQVAVDLLCTVTILPATRRGNGFDPSSVRVDPSTRLAPRSWSPA